jgi:hypothetical protein
VTGDDFDLTRWMFADFPFDLSLVGDAAWRELSPIVERLEGAMIENLSFKMNAGRRVGNYNLAKCRKVTDESDRVFARLLGMEDGWDEIELLYSQIVKTGYYAWDGGARLRTENGEIERG